MGDERYNQIIDEAYENYEHKLKLQNNWAITLSIKPLNIDNIGQQKLLIKEEFIDKCKTDQEFSEKWGLKIEERELTWEEQVQWVMENTDVEWENVYIVEEIAKKTTPKTLLTLTYNDIKTEIYE